MGQILPAKYRARFGITIIAFTNTANSAVLFIETVKTNGNLYIIPTNSNDLAMTSVVQMTDDVGNQYHFQAGPISVRASNAMVESFTEPLVSHQARKLRLQIHHLDDFTGRLAEEHVDFTIPNPAPRKAPRWKPQPLPLTNKCEDLQVELLELQTIILPKRQVFYAHDAPLDTNFHTRARLRILQNGRGKYGMARA